MNSNQSDHRASAGRAVKHAMLGVPSADAGEGRDGVFGEFQEWVDQCVWGQIWNRPGLDLRTRSAVTVAVLVATHADDSQLLGHLRGGVANGLTVEELVEVIWHTGGYAGAPAARRAVALAQRLIQEEQDSSGPALS